MGNIRVGLAVLSTSVNPVTDKILAQLGDERGATDGENAEWVQHVGFMSRPSKVDPGKASAQSVCVTGGDRDVCIGSQDARGRELAGLIAEGETVLYAGGETGTAQARVVLKADGSINIFTTDTNTRDGKSVYLRIGTGSDTNGLPDGLSFVAPWGTLKFDSAGFRVVHKSGASFELGGILGMPAPLDVISSYIRMNAGTINGTCSASSFGVTGQTPLAQSIPTLASFTALQTEVAALQVEIAAVAAALVAVAAIAGPVTPAHVSAAAPAAAAVLVGAAAVVTGAAAVTASALLVPATTSST